MSSICLTASLIRSPRRSRQGAMSRSVYIAIALAALWIVALLVAERLFLWPTTDPIDASGAERRLLTSDGQSIEVWIARSSLAEAYVLRFYGNADRAERWVASEARSFAHRAIELWGVSYPGFGGSPGSASLNGVAFAADVAARAIFAAAQGKPVFVFGTSIGTTAALRVAAEHPVRGVFLHNPTALAQIVRGNYGWWNLWLLALPVSWRIPHALDSVANAARAKAPAFVVHAADDEIVPIAYQELVARAYAGPKSVVVMTGAHHNDGLDAGAWRAFMSWWSPLL